MLIIHHIRSTELFRPVRIVVDKCRIGEAGQVVTLEWEAPYGRFGDPALGGLLRVGHSTAENVHTSELTARVP